MKKGAIVLVLGMALGTGVYAYNAGEKSSAFLKIGQGARAAGLAGAYSAIADESSAIYWNPAGLIQIKDKECSFMYHRPMTEVEGLSYSSLSLVIPSQNEAIGQNLVYLGYGKEKGYDNLGNSTNDWSASDMAISCAYAKRINQKLSIGGSLKAIQLKIDDRNCQSICLDTGLFYKDYYPNLNLSAVLTNLGTKPKSETQGDPLPLSLRLGWAYKKNLKFPTIIALDANLSPFYICLGLESQISPVFSARAGYASGPAKEGPGLTAGLGITKQSLSLDYAIRPYGELGLSHYISLSSKF